MPVWCPLAPGALVPQAPLGPLAPPSLLLLEMFPTPVCNLIPLRRSLKARDVPLVTQKMRYGLPQQDVSDEHLASVQCEVEVFRKWRVVAVNLNRER